MPSLFSVSSFIHRLEFLKFLIFYFEMKYPLSLTLFPPKTNIFVHGKNCTFSKKGLGHKGRCYSVCIDDTCK